MIIEDALYIYIYIYIYEAGLCDRSRLRCRRGNRKPRGFYSAIGAACGAGVAIADIVAWVVYIWEFFGANGKFEEGFDYPSSAVHHAVLCIIFGLARSPLGSFRDVAGDYSAVTLVRVPTI